MHRLYTQEDIFSSTCYKNYAWITAALRCRSKCMPGNYLVLFYQHRARETHLHYYFINILSYNEPFFKYVPSVTEYGIRRDPIQRTLFVSEIEFLPNQSILQELGIKHLSSVYRASTQPHVLWVRIVEWRKILVMQGNFGVIWTQGRSSPRCCGGRTKVVVLYCTRKKVITEDWCRFLKQSATPDVTTTIAKR